MEGNKARTTSLYDGEAKEVAHVKRVSDLVSKVSPWINWNLKYSKGKKNAFMILFTLQVLYRQKWDETKDRYLLPPDAPEFVLAVKNAANYSKVGTIFY